MRGTVLTETRSSLDGEGQGAFERLAVRPSSSTEGGPPVVVTSVGVPAPVDDHGRTRSGHDDVRDWMNPDLAEHLGQAHGGRALTDNDAHLAALAEGWIGAAEGFSDQVTLLTGTRLGAGIVTDGRLVRWWGSDLGRDGTGEEVVLAGAVMDGRQPLADAVSAALADHLDPPLPAVRASTLGADVVALGAVREALVHAMDHALDIDLPSARTATARPP